MDCMMCGRRPVGFVWVLPHPEVASMRVLHKLCNKHAGMVYRAYTWHEATRNRKGGHKLVLVPLETFMKYRKAA